MGFSVSFLQNLLFIKMKSKNNWAQSENDYSFSVQQAGRFTYFVFFGSAGLISVLSIVVSSWPVFWFDLKFFLFRLHFTIPLLLLGVVLHELLHAVVYWVYSGSKASVRFGFNKKNLTPYTWFRKPVAVWLYKISVLTPLIVLGIIPLGVSVLTKNPLVGIYSWVFIFTASADMYVFWKIRKLNPTLKVMDHPSRVGCYVIDN